MKFGLMFFATQPESVGRNRYRLLLESAKFADQNEFSSIWTPERHFDDFGGIFPNPALTSAALAMITERIELRAGSLISPIHDVIRIVEEWSVVDNLSDGRIAISFGSGWNINDFVFFPDHYQNRQKVMYSQIETIRRLWEGAPVVRRNSAGQDVEVTIYPQPVSPSLPIWITSSGRVETFIEAGARGANLLTHLIGQDLPKLEEKIQRYRQARRDAGFDPTTGKVALMLHTFLGLDPQIVEDIVHDPLCRYLKSAVLLENRSSQSGGAISGGHRGLEEDEEIPESVLEELLEITFERYYHTASLIGTPDKCQAFIQKLEAIGVNEVACLIDFGVETDVVLQSLHILADLVQSCSLSLC